MAKQHCRLSNWLEGTKHADWLEVLDSLCMLGMLGNHRTPATLVLPTAAVQKKLLAMINAGKSDDAIPIVKTYILYGGLNSGSEFKEAGCKANFALEVDKAGPAEVTLKNGAVLKKSKTFRPTKENLSRVWEMESGEMPAEGKPYKRPPIARVKGGSAIAGSTFRLEVYKDIQNRTLGLSGDALLPCYIDSVVSLLDCLSECRADFRETILPLLDANPITTFFLLVEPAKGMVSGPNSNDYVVSESEMKQWRNVYNVSTPGRRYTEYLDRSPQADACATLKATLTDAETVSVMLGTKVSDAYAAKYRQAAPKKLWQDLLRLMINNNPDAHEIHEISMMCMPGNDYQAEVTLFSSPSNLTDVNPSCRIDSLLTFIRSPYCFFPSGKDSQKIASVQAVTGQEVPDRVALFIRRNQAAVRRMLEEQAQ